MDYERRVQYDLTNLSEQEVSAIQAGLTLLANSATAGSIQYPEYKKTAAGMLGKLDVNGYNYDRPSANRPRLRAPDNNSTTT